MADYKSMYLILFRAMTRCIEIMQEAQIQTEEMYISEEGNIIRLNEARNSHEGDMQE